MKPSSLQSLAAFGTLIVLAACGSAQSPDTFPTDKLSGGADTGTGTGIDLGGGDGGTGTGNGGDGASCLQKINPAKPVPLHLVALMDYSGSMFNRDASDSAGAPISRFDAVKGAWEAYAALPQSREVRLTALPFGTRPALDGVDNCSENAFAPTMTDRPMPDTAAMSAAIVAGGPPTDWSNDTPTAGGVASALKAARALQAQFPNDAVAIVLSTDGAPSACGGSGNHADPDPVDTDAAVRALQAAVAAGFKTYVVGVATNDAVFSSALTQLAAASGGGEATLISSTTSTEIAQRLQGRLAAVGREYLCKIPLSDAALGNLAQTNVTFRPSASAESSTLSYGADCSGAAGYRYDDPAAPRNIVLCPSTCAAFGAADDSEVQLAVGCEARVQ